MKFFYESLPLNIILKLIKEELMTACNTTNVEIKGLLFDDGVYEDEGDGPDKDIYQMITVIATIKGTDERHTEDYGTHQWLFEWSYNYSNFCSIMRTDQ